MREELEKGFKPGLNASPADALDEREIEYHYQVASLTLNLTALQGSSVEEAEKLKMKMLFMKALSCLLVK